MKQQRAAIIARVSTDQQTTRNQSDELILFCDSQGWKVVATYGLQDSSSSRGWRQVIQEMLEAASRREFDVLVFWALDRLSREGALDCLDMLTRLRSYGVNFRSFREPFLDTSQPFGDAIVAFVATIARMERDRIRERTRAGVARARREGKTIGRPRVVVDVERLANHRGHGCTLQQLSKEFAISPATAFRLLRAWERNKKTKGA